MVSYLSGEKRKDDFDLRNELYQRELSWVALFSMAMHVFSGIFGSFIKVLIFIFLPISLLESVILGRMNATTIALQAFTQAADPNTVNVEGLVGLLSQMLTQEFLLFAVTLFLQPVGIIAIAKMTKQYIDGEKVEASKAIGEALNHMPAIMITASNLIAFFAITILVDGFLLSDFSIMPPNMNSAIPNTSTKIVQVIIFSPFSVERKYNSKFY